MIAQKGKEYPKNEKGSIDLGKDTNVKTYAKIKGRKHMAKAKSGKKIYVAGIEKKTQQAITKQKKSI